MKFRNQIRLMILLAFTGIVISGNAQDANTILKKMDEVLYAPKDMTATNTIILIDKNGKQEGGKPMSSRKVQISASYGLLHLHLRLGSLFWHCRMM